MATKIAIEKLLNTLGKQMAMEYYGLDLNFSVIDIEDGVIKVKTDKPIPQIFDVKIEPDFTYGKYATIKDLNGNLEHLLKYVGMNHAEIHHPEHPINDMWGHVLDIRLAANETYINNPEKFVELESVGSALEKETGYVYPMTTLMFKGIDISMGVSLADIEDDNWWEALSVEDKQKLNDIYS